MQTISPSLVLLRCIYQNLQEFCRTSYCSDVLRIKMACADIEEGIIRLERYEVNAFNGNVESYRTDLSDEIIKKIASAKDAFSLLDVAKRGSAAPETLTSREVAQMAFALEACLTFERR